MASLTDIIFLLLIFFMLTSTLVGLRPMELPRSNAKTVAATSVIVSIRKDGQYAVNNRDITSNAMLEREVAEAVRKSRGEAEDFTITIAAEVGTPFDYVVNVMKVASRLRVKAIIATQPKDS